MQGRREGKRGLSQAPKKTAGLGINLVRLSLVPGTMNISYTWIHQLTFCYIFPEKPLQEVHKPISGNANFDDK